MTAVELTYNEWEMLLAVLESEAPIESESQGRLRLKVETIVQDLTFALL